MTNANLFFTKHLVLILTLLSHCASNVKLSAQINFETYKGKLATDKVQLIVFTAGWCGSCKEMKKNVFQDKDLSVFVNDNFNAYLVDVDKDRTGITGKYNVSGLPTFIFVSESGELLYKGVGYRDVDEFLKKSQFSLKKAAGKLTDRDRIYECMEKEPSNSCEELLKNYLQNNDWKSSEENAIAVIDYALNDNKMALNHLMQNKAEYSKVVSLELVNTAMLMFAQQEMKEMMVKAFEKKSEPDWKKVEQILAKYKGAGNYIADLYGIKSTYFYELGSWSKYINASNEYIQAKVKNYSGEEKGGNLYKETKILIEDIDNYEKKLTATEEKQAADLIYKLLSEAEKLLPNPDANLYFELHYAAGTLDLNEEDFYFKVYEKINNGQNANEAKKEAKAEVDAEEN